MRKRVAWPGVAAKTAKGRTYYYWTRTTPWVRLPDPADQPDQFMRKLAALQRVELASREGSAGSLKEAIGLYERSPDFTDKSANTRKLYGVYLAELVEVFPGAALIEVTPDLVQRFVMDENIDRRGAANMMLRVLHIVYKWIGKRRPHIADPTRGVEEFDTGEHEPWPDEVLAAALASDDQLFSLAVALHYYTGQRTGDACRMTWNVITPEQLIPVRQQKTGSALLIPMHPDLARRVQSAPKVALTILSNREGRALKSAAFLSWVRAFGAAHGVRLVSHGLRKNAVNGLFESGCSTAEISAITGQSLGMIEHYGKRRNQPAMASAAMLKWGAGHSENGKTIADQENGAAK